MTQAARREAEIQAVELRNQTIGPQLQRGAQIPGGQPFHANLDVGKIAHAQVFADQAVGQTRQPAGRRRGGCRHHHCQQREQQPSFPVPAARVRLQNRSVCGFIRHDRQT